MDKIIKRAGINLEAGDTGYLVGYANIYNTMDLQGDISSPTSFVKTVSERKPKIKIYRNHDPNQFVGIPIELDAYDQKGLRLTAKMLMDTDAGRNAYTEAKFLTENGFEAGFSIGGWVVKRDKENNAIVTEYKLSEISILTMEQANVGSMVDLVKSLENKPKVEEFWQLIEKAYNEQFSDNILKSLENFLTLKGKPYDNSRNTSVIDEPSIITNIYKQIIGGY